MPRRDQEQREAALDSGTHQAILDATEQHLATHSLGQLSVASIVDAAGVSRATFYLHFASKQAVLRELFRQMLDAVYDVFTHTWDPAGTSDPRPALRQALAASYAHFRQHGAVARAAAELWLHDDGADGIGREFRAMITRLIEASQERMAAANTPLTGGEAAGRAAALIWMNERCFHVHSLGAEPAFPSDDAMLDALADVWVAVVYRGSAA